MVNKKLEKTLAPLRVTPEDKQFLDELSHAFDEPVSKILRGSIQHLKKHDDPIKELSSCI